MDENHNSFRISTKLCGDFEKRFNVFSSYEQDIKDYNRKFVWVILEILENENRQIEFRANAMKITSENACFRINY